MTKKEAIEWLQDIKETEAFTDWAYAVAIDMAIEALEREDHDGCDGCMYEHYEELTEPCYSCKHNYTDRYMPEPKHDRDWIVGCIKHDGFIKTDRGDKANQIILEALKADRPRGEWIESREQNILMAKRIEKGETWRVCSNCGTGYMIGAQYEGQKSYGERFHNFCPNCGADMRERSEE